ncbi:MAG TPA: hypothetical protein VM492_16470, partial [Sumerlaeia bacterium]|nr:hypothetical protein [Sumerlaeia bacterium]
MAEKIRRLPYRQPRAGLLDRLLADLPGEGDAEPHVVQSRLGSVTVAFRRLVLAHAAICILLAAASLALGAVAVHRFLFISDGFREYGIKIDPDDPAIRTAVAAYREYYEGKEPRYFHQLTTPVAFFTGPWAPGWGKPRRYSEQEVREWEELPRWAKHPWAGGFNDYRKWESLSKTEWKEWVDWKCQDDIRVHLVHERFSPDQRRRVLRLADDAAVQTMRVLPGLVARKASKKEFDEATLDIWKKCQFEPMRDIFREMSHERPLLIIHPAVHTFRKQHGKPPSSLGDIKPL